MWRRGAVPASASQYRDPGPYFERGKLQKIE
jgi:hypothetical protein